MSDSVKMWAVKDKFGNFKHIGDDEEKAWGDSLDFEVESLKRDGYRCVPVEIREMSHA